MGYTSQVSVEYWIWFTLCILAVCSRFVSQYMLYGRHFLLKNHIDNYIIIFATCTYTICITCMYNYDAISNSIDYDTISDDDSVKYGRNLGIINILAETSMQTTLWCIKASLLVLYYQITYNLSQNRAFIAVSIYTALGYVAILAALYGGWCRPFSQYLVLVPEVEQCFTWVKYSITQMTINISSDIMILIIPISAVLATKYTLGRKIQLVSIFGLGVFVIIAAFLQKYYVLRYPDAQFWILWDVREVSTAMLVGNLIMCRPLVRKAYGYFNPTLDSPSSPVVMPNTLGNASHKSRRSASVVS